MSLSLRELLNSVLTQSAFLERDSFTTSVDVDDRQMVAIANRTVIEIMNYYNWSILRKDHTVTMTESGGVPDTSYALPADFQNLTPDSAWETDGSRRVELPVPESRWFMYKYTTFSDGGMIRARFYGPNIEIYEPEPGETITFEYVSNAPVLSSSLVPQERFLADTDTQVFDDQLFILGTQANWAETKLLPQFPQWKANYLSKMNEAIGRDAGARTVGGTKGDYDWMTRRSPYYPLWR